VVEHCPSSGGGKLMAPAIRAGMQPARGLKVLLWRNKRRGYRPKAPSPLRESSCIGGLRLLESYEVPPRVCARALIEAGGPGLNVGTDIILAAPVSSWPHSARTSGRPGSCGRGKCLSTNHLGGQKSGLPAEPQGLACHVRPKRTVQPEFCRASNIYSGLAGGRRCAVSWWA